MTQLTSNELSSLFEHSLKLEYKKHGVFIYRFARQNETILTIVSGKLETIKTADSNTDIVIRNILIGSSAETYIINETTFKQRYTTDYKSIIVDGLTWCYCYPNGQIEAMLYLGPTISFMAPWNELMICNHGDYIARPIGGKETDIYRIEKETFSQTYQLI